MDISQCDSIVSALQDISRSIDISTEELKDMNEKAKFYTVEMKKYLKAIELELAFIAEEISGK